MTSAEATQTHTHTHTHAKMLNSCHFLVFAETEESYPIAVCQFLLSNKSLSSQTRPDSCFDNGFSFILYTLLLLTFFSCQMTLLSLILCSRNNHPPLHRYLISRLDLSIFNDILYTFSLCFESSKCNSLFSMQGDFPSVNLCAYPFILNAQAKTTMLQTDAELQMQVRAARDQK